MFRNPGKPVLHVRARNRERSLLVRGGRVARVGDSGATADIQLDATQHHVIPGLINCHDHLDLSAYPRFAPLAPYPSGHAWGADIMGRTDSEPALLAGRKVPRRTAMVFGALLNLIHGVTTVQHHNPLTWRERSSPLPVCVPSRYTHAHSPRDARPLALLRQGARAMGGVFVLHAGEGTDPITRRELADLDKRGLLGPWTLVVHAVGADREDVERLARTGTTVVWCPSSNDFVLGETLDPRQLLSGGVPLTLGTDSPLTRCGGMLDELRFARDASGLPASQLFDLVTRNAAQALKIRRGELTPGSWADLLLLRPQAGDPAEDLLASTPEDVALVIRDGMPVCAAPEFGPLFERFGVEAKLTTIGPVERLVPTRWAAAPGEVAALRGDLP